MAQQEKKTILDLPLKLVLTDEGTTFFIKNKKKINKFKLADNVEEYGLILDRFYPASVQRMILIDYVSRLEISRSDFMSARQDIMDLSKLVVYAMLYRQFDNQIFGKLLGSDVIKRWNRANPSNAITEQTKIPEGVMQARIQESQKLIYEVKQRILEPIYLSITRNTQLMPEEKNIHLLLSEKFLNNLRPFIWFIISQFHGLEGFDLLMKSIRSSLSDYVEKTKIAEYIAFMIMELAMNAENSNLKKAARKIFQGTVDMNAVLFDPQIRAKVVSELEKSHELVYLSWKIGGKSGSIGTHGRLQITLYNKESEFASTKQTIDDKKKVNLKDKSLFDFYRELPEDEADTGLGLYYLSYLNEACDKVNIKFESLVNQIKENDLTVITLTLHL
jgi:hypothetical protein